MIKLHHVSKYYGTQLTLNQVNLEVMEGECLVLIGPSGCGKSTLLKSINRLVDLESGEIEVLGKSIHDWRIEDLRKQMGYCIQSVGLFPHLSVKENIALVLRVMKMSNKDIDQRVDELLTLTQLPLDYKTKRPHELSGGEAQRVGVCRALATNPPILLMDEPFGALDPLTRELVQKAFLDIQKRLNKTVVFVTHDIDEAILLADRIAFMHQGQIMSVSSPEHIAQSEDAFSTNFVGKDYLLKLLQRFQVKDLACKRVKEAKTLVDLNQSSNLKEALALLLSADTETVFYKDLNQTYALSYQEIQSFIQRIQDESVA